MPEKPVIQPSLWSYVYIRYFYPPSTNPRIEKAIVVKHLTDGHFYARPMASSQIKCETFDNNREKSSPSWSDLSSQLDSRSFEFLKIEFWPAPPTIGTTLKVWIDGDERSGVVSNAAHGSSFRVVNDYGSKVESIEIPPFTITFENGSQVGSQILYSIADEIRYVCPASLRALDVFQTDLEYDMGFHSKSPKEPLSPTPIHPDNNAFCEAVPQGTANGTEKMKDTSLNKSKVVDIDSGNNSDVVEVVETLQTMESSTSNHESSIIDLIGTDLDNIHDTANGNIAVETTVSKERTEKKTTCSVKSPSKIISSCPDATNLNSLEQTGETSDSERHMTDRNLSTNGTIALKTRLKNSGRNGTRSGNDSIPKLANGEGAGEPPAAEKCFAGEPGMSFIFTKYINTSQSASNGTVTGANQAPVTEVKATNETTHIDQRITEKSKSSHITSNDVNGSRADPKGTLARTEVDPSAQDERNEEESFQNPFSNSVYDNHDIEDNDDDDENHDDSDSDNEGEDYEIDDSDYEPDSKRDNKDCGCDVSLCSDTKSEYKKRCSRDKKRFEPSIIAKYTLLEYHKRLSISSAKSPVYSELLKIGTEFGSVLQRTLKHIDKQYKEELTESANETAALPPTDAINVRFTYLKSGRRACRHGWMVNLVRIVTSAFQVGYYWKVRDFETKVTLYGLERYVHSSAFALVVLLEKMQWEAYTLKKKREHEIEKSQLHFTSSIWLGDGEKLRRAEKSARTRKALNEKMRRICADLETANMDILQKRNRDSEDEGFNSKSDGVSELENTLTPTNDIDRVLHIEKNRGLDRAIERHFESHVRSEVIYSRFNEQTLSAAFAHPSQIARAQSNFKKPRTK